MKRVVVIVVLCMLVWGARGVSTAAPDDDTSWACYFWTGCDPSFPWNSVVPMEGRKTLLPTAAQGKTGETFHVRGPGILVPHGTDTINGSHDTITVSIEHVGAVTWDSPTSWIAIIGVLPAKP